MVTTWPACSCDSSGAGEIGSGGKARGCSGGMARSIGDDGGATCPAPTCARAALQVTQAPMSAMSAVDRMVWARRAGPGTAPRNPLGVKVLCLPKGDLVNVLLVLFDNF